MKKVSILVVVLACLIGGARGVLAQETGSAGAEAQITDPNQLEADAGGDKIGIVDRAVVFDASKSIVPKIPPAEGTLPIAPIYRWDFGDGSGFDGISEVHKYAESGDYTATLNVIYGDRQSTADIRVRIFSNVIVMLSDGSAKAEQMSEWERYALQQEIYLQIIERKDPADFMKEEFLAQDLLSISDELNRTTIIIDYTSGSVGLNALSKFAQKVPTLSDFSFDKKVVVSVTKSPTVVARTAQSTYDILRPEYIILIDETSLHSVIEAESSSQVLENIQNSRQSYNLIGAHTERSINELSPLNFLAYVNNYLVNRGVPIETLYLLLTVPIIATMVSFVRQIVGIKAYGIYIATIITLAFLVTGIKYGIALVVIILLTSFLIRLLMKRLKLLYLPRMAIMLTLVATVIYAMYGFAAATNRTGFLAIGVFPILIITMLSEKFVEEQIKEGIKNAALVSLYTLIISVVGYYLVSWQAFRSLLLSYPELVIITIAINFIMGKFTGLRLTEYFRFTYVKKS